MNTITHQPEQLSPRLDLALSTLMKFYGKYAIIPDLVVVASFQILKTEPAEQILMFFIEVEDRCPELLALFYRLEDLQDRAEELEGGAEEDCSGHVQQSDAGKPGEPAGQMDAVSYIY